MTTTRSDQTSRAQRRVFLSYAHDDADLGRRLEQVLVAADIDVAGPNTIRPGEHWLAAVSDAIERADACVVLVSKRTARSTGVLEEAALAVGKALASPKTAILPVALDRDVTLPFPLSQFQALRLDSSEPDAPSIAAAILEALGRSAPRHSTTEELERSVARQSAALAYDRALEAARLELRGRATFRFASAFWLVAFAVLIAITVVSLLQGKSQWIGAVLAPAVAILGAATGFYFGRNHE